MRTIDDITILHYMRLFKLEYIHIGLSSVICAANNIIIPTTDVLSHSPTPLSLSL